MKGLRFAKHLPFNKLFFRCTLHRYYQQVLAQPNFKRQPKIMVKQTQTIRRWFGDELLECVCPSCGAGP